MIGVLIITHGTIGEAMLRTASATLGTTPPAVRVFGVSVGDDPDLLMPRLRTAATQLNSGDGVLVLSDMYGATPCNIASRLLEPGQVDGVSGLNLPMLMRVLTYRNQALPDLVDKACAGGSDGVVHMTSDCCHDAKR
ncbi:MAG: PTS fructose transporter subunit IIA [Proteobacteria bacterium]|nr:PTS fructose transporter subunit IIA [Pseudomonadota bacterium]